MALVTAYGVLRCKRGDGVMTAGARCASARRVAGILLRAAHRRLAPRAEDVRRRARPAVRGGANSKRRGGGRGGGSN